MKLRPLGFATPQFDEQIPEGEYANQLKRLFRPEFLNRIDEIIVFESLSREEIRQIVMLLMHDISTRMEEMGFSVELTEAAANHLGEVGYDPTYGARPLRRLLQRRIENELSKRLLKGEYATGDHVLVDYDPGTWKARTSSPSPRSTKRRLRWTRWAASEQDRTGNRTAAARPYMTPARRRPLQETRGRGAETFLRPAPSCLPRYSAHPPAAKYATMSGEYPQLFDKADARLTAPGT